MNQVVALAKGKHGAEHCVAHAGALALARAGRLHTAPPIIQPGHGPGSCKMGNARREQVTGRRERCGKPFTEMPPKEKGGATEALELSKGREVQYAACLALAFSGESSRSEALTGDLEKRFPEDAFYIFTKP